MIIVAASLACRLWDCSRATFNTSLSQTVIQLIIQLLWMMCETPICSWAFQKHLEFIIATTKVITKESVSGLLQS